MLPRLGDGVWVMFERGHRALRHPHGVHASGLLSHGATHRGVEDREGGKLMALSKQGLSDRIYDALVAAFGGSMYAVPDGEHLGVVF